jgi:hypothetical protein
MLGLAYSAWRLSRKIFNIPVVVDLIFFFVFVKIGLYYLLPTLMRIASDYQFEREDSVVIFDLAKLYFIELISWSVWMTALLAVFSIVGKNKKRLELSEFFNFRHSESKIILVVLALGFVATRISALTDAQGSLFLEVFKSLFFYAGLASGPFLMVISLRYFGKTIFVLGVGASLLSLLAISTRGAIVYMALFCSFLVWFVLRDRISKIITISVVSALSVIYFTFGGLISGSIVIDESGSVSVVAGVGADKKGARSTLEEIPESVNPYFHRSIFI